MNTLPALPAILLTATFGLSGCVTQAAARAPAAPVAPAPVESGLDFHAALAPFGTWTTLAPYGAVWVPRVPIGWRPYTCGHWILADSIGWTWVADEPWGWAPFHYGRWTLDATLGWVWIPGDVWGPAWVAWRQCDGFIGWAPLPPCVGWTAGIGLAWGGADVALVIGEPWWSFVPLGCLGHPRVREVLLVPERALAVLHRSQPIRRTLFVENGRAVNRPVAREAVEKASGRPVQRVALGEVKHLAALRHAPVTAARPPDGPGADRALPARPGPSARAQVRSTNESAHDGARQNRQRHAGERSEKREG